MRGPIKHWFLLFLLAGCGATAGATTQAVPPPPPLAGVVLGANLQELRASCDGRVLEGTAQVSCARVPAAIDGVAASDYFVSSVVACGEDPAFCERCDEMPGACGASLRVSPCSGHEETICEVEVNIALRAAAGAPQAAYESARRALAVRFGEGYPAGTRRCQLEPVACLADGDEVSHRFEGVGHILELTLRRSWLPESLGVTAFMTVALRAK